ARAARADGPRRPVFHGIADLLPAVRVPDQLEAVGGAGASADHGVDQPDLLPATPFQDGDAHSRADPAGRCRVGGGGRDHVLRRRSVVFPAAEAVAARIRVGGQPVASCSWSSTRGSIFQSPTSTNEVLWAMRRSDFTE